MWRLILLVALTAGCTRELADYPADWPRIPSRPECTAVAGRYSDGGERAGPPPGGGYSRLSHLATGHETLFGGTRGVTLSFPEPGVFLITGGAERRFSFAKGEVACVNGSLELTRTWSDRAARGPTWWRTTVALTRATNGWLIAEWQESESALRYWVAPTQTRLREWYRFGPISETLARQPLPPFAMRNIWRKAGASEAQFNDASLGCGRTYVSERAYARCMTAKGWERADVPGRGMPLSPGTGYGPTQ